MKSYAPMLLFNREKRKATHNGSPPGRRHTTPPQPGSWYGQCRPDSLWKRPPTRLTTDAKMVSMYPTSQI
jgi:hypothetical protein